MSLILNKVMVFLIVLIMTFVSKISTQIIQTINIENCILQYLEICYICATPFILSYSRKICLDPNKLRSTHKNCFQVDLQQNCVQCQYNQGKSTNNGCDIINKQPDGIEFCAQYDSKNLCLRCKNFSTTQIDSISYALNNDRTRCLSNNNKVKFCFQYNSDESRCLSCIQDFHLESQENLCLRNQIQECLMVGQHEEENICLLCQENFIKAPNQKTCFKKIANCVKINNSGSCELCQEGYSFKDNWLNCQQTNNQHCMMGVEDPVSKKCLSCQDDYQFTEQGICQPAFLSTLTQCEKFQQSKFCIRCKKGLMASWDGKLCIPASIPGCLIQAFDDQFCHQCDSESGFITIQYPYAQEMEKSNCVKKQDYPYLVNCRVALNEYTCRYCQDGFFQGIGSYCYDSQKTNCLIGGSDKDCWVCDQNFIVRNGICETRSRKLNAEINLKSSILRNFECLETDENYEKCLVCDPNSHFKKEEQLCLQKDPYHSILNNEFNKIELKKGVSSNDTTLAQSCYIGYQLIQGMCLNQNSLQQFDQFYYSEREFELYLQGETSIVPNKKCLPGHKKLTACFPIVHSQCNEYSFCSYCSFTSIDQDYAFFNLIRSCVDNNIYPYQIRYCREYKDSLHQCQDCQYGYKPTYDQLTGNIIACSPLIENCFFYDTISLCQKCKQGYVLNLDRNKCFKETEKLKMCQQVYDNGICESCQQTTEQFLLDLNTNSCINSNLIQGVDLNCLIFYFTSEGLFRCRLCQDFYNIDNLNGKCVTIYTCFIINCQETAILDLGQEDPSCVCQFCAQGMFLQNNHCYKSINNCYQYDETKSYCLLCQIGYLLSDDQLFCREIKPPFNQFFQCAAFSQNSCLTCVKGYTIQPQSGLCVIQDENCINATQFGCLECREGYFLYLDLICFQSIEFCEEYDISGICLKCAEGYSMRIDQRKCSSNPKLENCLVYEDPGVCQRGYCKPGYHIKQNDPTGKCQILIEGCGSVDKFGNCESCLDPTKKMTILKINCVNHSIKFCEEYTQENVCSRCKEGYVISDDFSNCYLTIPGCSEYLQNGQCQRCETKTTISSKIEKQEGVLCITEINDGSKSNPFFCQKYQKSNNGKYEHCIQCAEGLTLLHDSSKCVYLPTDKTIKQLAIPFDNFSEQDFISIKKFFSSSTNATYISQYPVLTKQKNGLRDYSSVKPLVQIYTHKGLSETIILNFYLFIFFFYFISSNF